MPFDTNLLEPVTGKGFDLSLLEPIEGPRDARRKALLAERAEEAKVGEITENQYKFLAGLERVVEPFTAAGMLNQPARLTGQPDPYRAGAGIVPREVAKQAAELSPAFQVFKAIAPETGGAAEGVKELTGTVLSGLTTPEMVVEAPAAGPSRLVRAAFGTEMVHHLPEQVHHAVEVLASPTATTSEKVQAIGEPAVTAAMVTALSAPGLAKTPTQRSLEALERGEPTVIIEQTKAAGAPATAEALKEVLPAAKEPVPLEQAPLPTEASVAEVQLGVRPTGSAALDKVIEYFRPPPDSPAPPVVPDVSTPLPDLQPKATANAVFSQPFAAEKIPVLGRLLGGRARIRNEQDQAVAAWFGERHGVGPAVASAVGEQIRGKVNNVFVTDEAGNLNVTPRTEGQSLKISDVFEELQRDSNNYQLSPEQQAVWNETVKPILERHKELTEQYELLDTVDEQGGFGEYFPRIVTERPAERVGTLAGGKRVGAKQFFQKERAFKSESEGWEKGYKYERDVEKRLVTAVERLYRAMADKRLANDPVLGGKTRVELEGELREAYAEELGSGEKTEADITRIASGLQQVGTVWQPGFFGKIFEAETANMLNKEFGREQSSIRRAIANTNDFIKALNLGFDIGVGQIQLLPTLFRHPTIWAQAQVRSIGAMFNPRVWSAYAEQNIVPIRELAQFGSSVGRLPEMVSGLTGGVIPRIPVLREAAKPFARQFHTALDVAKVEMWKAWREVTPREEWNKTIQAIESVLTTARMEPSMIPHRRALIERVLTLAPSYYRGAVNLIAALGEKGTTGKVARQAMGSFIAGSSAMYIGIGLALGMTMEEITERLNPMRPDFAMWTVDIGGKKRNIGIGGIFRSFLRLTGNVAKTSIEEPENWKSLNPKKNPFTRWYRGHAGPTIAIAWDQFSGKDFIGHEASLETAPQRLGPLWLQNVISRQKGEPTKSIPEVAAEFAGLQTFPDTGPSGEVSRLARSWMAKSETPKVQEAFKRKQQEEFGLSDYAELYRALDESDTKGAVKAIQELRQSKKDADIVEAMRTARRRAFTGMDRLSEMQFRRSLIAEEKQLYAEALKQRADRYRNFLKAWGQRGQRKPKD